MNDILDQQIQTAIEKIGPDIRNRIQRQIELMRGQGVDAFQALVRITKNQAEDADLRAAVCWLLGQLGKKSAANALIVTLSGPETNVVQEAAKSLGMIQSKKALRPLISLLQQAENPDHREAAAFGLGALGDKRAVEPLIQVLSNPHETPSVRGFCAEALASLGDRRAATDLMAALDDPATEVRFWSVYALGELKEPRAIAKLERLAETDQAELPGWGTVSAEAANAIASIKASSPSE